MKLSVTHKVFSITLAATLILGVCGFLYWRFKRTRWL